MNKQLILQVTSNKVNICYKLLTLRLFLSMLARPPPPLVYPLLLALTRESHD